jgi:GYF domain 2
MPEVQWYYARNDQQFGPISAAELKQLADSGQLSPDDLLWREGMDSWATAINLRGLFTSEAAANTPPVEQSATIPQPVPVAPPRTQPAPRAAQGVSLRPILRTTQIVLWSMCVLVVLAGVVLFTRAFLIADNPTQEAAAAAVFATFFIAAYVLARSGEKLSRLLLARARRRR